MNFYPVHFAVFAYMFLMWTHLHKADVLLAFCDHEVASYRLGLYEGWGVRGNGWQEKGKQKGYIYNIQSTPLFEAWKIPGPMFG